MANLQLVNGLHINYNNGFFSSQIQLSRALNETNAFPLHNNVLMVNLTIFSDATLQLNVLQGQNNSNLLALPLIANLLNPEASRVLVECVCPLNGQHNTLPRISFYLSLLLGFVSRHRNWVGQINQP